MILTERTRSTVCASLAETGPVSARRIFIHCGLCRDNSPGLNLIWE